MNAAIPLRERVLAAAAAAPSLTRRKARRIAAGLAALSAAIALLLFHLAGGVAQAAGRPPVVSVRVADGWGFLAAGLTWLTLRRCGGAERRSPHVLAIATLAYPATLLAWSGLFLHGWGAPPAAADLSCAAYTLLAATTPLASFLILRRGVEPDHPTILGGAAGAICGGWASVLFTLACPAGDPAHVVVGHAAPVALLIVVGGRAGRAMLGLQPRLLARR